MAYVYRHIRLDKNEPFYIGIGSDTDYKRAFKKTQRTWYWQNIASSGYDVDILLENLTWEQACEKEKEFIALYGRKDLGTGTLVNMTDGGEGNLNPPESIRKKISAAHKGKPSHRLNKPLTEAHKKNISNALKGVSKSKEHVEKNKTAAKNRVRLKCEYCNVVANINNYKLWHGDRCKSKLGNENIDRKHKNSRAKVECEHCLKWVDPSGYSRWHGSNCKLFINYNRNEETNKRSKKTTRTCRHCKRG